MANDTLARVKELFRKPQAKWLLLGIGAFALWKIRNIPWRFLPENARIQYAMEPTSGTAGQLASLQTYRLIENRREGMTYTPVTKVEAGESLVFTVPKTGTITRNVLVEGGKKYVEVA